MKSKVYLFTSPTCPNCPPAKRFIQDLSDERDDFEVEEHSTMYRDSMALAREFDVSAVPTFIIRGPKFENNIGYVGIPNKARFNELLDISQGIKREEAKKKGFSFGSLFKF